MCLHSPSCVSRFVLTLLQYVRPYELTKRARRVSIMQVGFKRYYAFRTLFVRARGRTLVILLRLLIVIAMCAVSLIPLAPVWYLMMQSVLSVAACSLAYLQHFRLSLDDIEQYVKHKRASQLTAPKHRSSYKAGAMG